MRLSITNAVRDILKNRFHFMLENGFPEVRYESHSMGHSYLLMEYSTAWATFAKVVDEYMKANHLDEELGVFSRKRSKDFLSNLKVLVGTISEDMVKNSSSRFKGWMD